MKVNNNVRKLALFSRIRRKPQQPLNDLAQLYKEIASETIFYLSQEEKGDIYKAYQGWKALRTKVLYKLTEIERGWPNTNNHTRDELNLKSGIMDLYHRSLEHFERVSKLYEKRQIESQKKRRLLGFKAHSIYPSNRSLFSNSSPNNIDKAVTFRGSNLSKHAESCQSLPLGTLSRDAHVERNFKQSLPKLTGNFEGFDVEMNMVGLSEFEDKKKLDSASAKVSMGNGEASDDGLKNSEVSNAFDVEDYEDNGSEISQKLFKLKLGTIQSSPGLNIDKNRNSSNLGILGSQDSIQDVAGRSFRSSFTTSMPSITKSLNHQKSLGPLVSQKTESSASAMSNHIKRAKQKNSVFSGSKIPVKRFNQHMGLTKYPVRNIVSKSVAGSKNSTLLSPNNILSNHKALRERKACTVLTDNTKGTSSGTNPQEFSSVIDSNENIEVNFENEMIESMRGVDKDSAKQIFSEIVVKGDEVHWHDIAGLESAKSSLKEAVVYPFLRPDLFRGLREPVRGMLLFGPPGTGKTMLARAVATESHSTFFSISASSLTSKFLGESEKLVRALFAVAKKLSPSIVFVDEIDSILGSRNNENENEASRRIKNEFLIQWSSLSNAAAGNDDGGEDERVLVLAATNLPWSIDDAARRRFVRRQYIPLPEGETRKLQISRLLSKQKHTITGKGFAELIELTNGYSGSDITSLAKDAAMVPLRELGDRLLSTPNENIRPITLEDFKNSLNYIKPSVSKDGLLEYEKWAERFGSSGV